MSDQDVIHIDRKRPGIAIVTLDRPERLNALNDGLVRGIHGAFDALSREEDVRVVILTGAGAGFCAGMDIRASVARRAEENNVAARYARQEMFAGMVLRIRAMKQPVIAAVNGPAAGAGLGLALASDIRIASPEAKFLVAAIRIGLTAGECGISYHLPRLIGASRAFEVMLTGRPILADEAERIGLVSRIVPRAELLEEALRIAGAILENSPFGVRQTKQVMWNNLDARGLGPAIELENRAQIVTVQTEDFVEATRAFAEKRKPVFKGR